GGVLDVDVAGTAFDLGAAQTIDRPHVEVARDHLDGHPLRPTRSDGRAGARSRGCGARTASAELTRGVPCATSGLSGRVTGVTCALSSFARSFPCDPPRLATNFTPRLAPRLGSGGS